MAPDAGEIRLTCLKLRKKCHDVKGKVGPADQRGVREPALRTRLPCSISVIGLTVVRRL